MRGSHAMRIARAKSSHSLRGTLEALAHQRVKIGAAAAPFAEGDSRRPGREMGRLTREGLRPKD